MYNIFIDFCLCWTAFYLQWSLCFSELQEKPSSSMLVCTSVLSKDIKTLMLWMDLWLRFFFFNGQKAFVQQINKVKRRLSLLRNKSKTSLLKYHVIIESLLWKMRWCLDFTKRKITVSLLAQWNNKTIKNIIFPCIFHCKCPSIFSFQSKELSSLCLGGNWSWLGSCFGGLRPWL